MSRQLYNLPANAPLPPLPRPMVQLSLALMGGIIYARYFPLSLPFTLILMLALVLMWITTFRKGLMGPRKAVHWAMALILTGLLGAVRMEIQRLSWRALSLEVEALNQSGICTIAGTVEEVHVYETEKAAVILTAVRLGQQQQERLFPGKLEITGPAASLAQFRPGDGLRTEGTLYPVPGPRIPGFLNTRQSRYSLEIFATVPVRQETPLVRNTPAHWSPARGFAYSAMDAIQKQLDTRTVPARDEIGSLLGSICFGLRSGMPEGLRDALSGSGLAHVTSISGLHVSLVLFGLGYGLKQIGFKRRHAALITVCFSFFYILLVGARIPTLRAALMAFVFLGGYFTERRIDSLNSLALAAFLLLLVYPVELFLPAFQLSFTAVLILILIHPYGQILGQKIRFRPLAWLLQGFLASAAVSLGMAPLTIAYFQAWSWGAIPGNLAAIPITNVLMPVTYLWALSLALPVPPLSRILESLSVHLSEGLRQTIFFCSNPDLFQWEIAFASPVMPAALFFSILLLARPGLLLFYARSIPFRSAHAALALLGAVFWSLPFTQIDPPLRIDFLSLGQGDCSVIQTPRGRVILIDGGAPERSRVDSTTPALVDFLASQGISAIDLMILSHPEDDHIGELGAVAERYPAAGLLEGTRNQDSDSYRRLVEIIEQRQIPCLTARKGTRIDIEPNLSAWVLSPDSDTLLREKDVNDQSIVLILRYQSLNLLFTGDISESIEQRLCAAYDNWDVEVLKVPHHGSRFSTSTLFLSEVRPEFAVIQVGRNRYGHPHLDTLNRLRNAGATVLRTDLEGTVTLISRGSGFQIHTSASNRVYQYRPERGGD